MDAGFLGIDLGTSSVKVAVLDERGRLRATATRPYAVRHPAPHAAESDPADWWHAVAAASREAATAAAADDLAVAALGLVGQMHGVVLAGADGMPTRPAVLWADTRATDQLAAWRALPAALRAALANPIVPGMAGPILCRIQQGEPESLARARWALQPKDWLRLRLTGRAATDPSDASATLLWDIPGDRWAAEVIAAVGLSTDRLAPVLGSAEVAGSLTSDAADALGVPPGVPVAVGAGDTAAGLLASGVALGETLLTLGTGAQVARLHAHPMAAADPVVHVYRAAEPRRWYVMAAVQNAGLALAWVRGVLAATWDEIYAAAAAAPAPATGRLPVFLPYLTGERTPVLDAGLRARWVELDASHDRSAVIASAVRGVAFAVRHALAALGDPPPELLVSGGGARDGRMRRLLVDVLGVPLRPLQCADASAVGAALLAAAAAGHPLAPAASRLAAVAPEQPERYAEDYARYLTAVRQLTGRDI